MSKVNVWNTMGYILKQFDSVDEAEAWMEECEHEELSRTVNGGDVNIAVATIF